jgi:hypothetical protein
MAVFCGWPSLVWRGIGCPISENRFGGSVADHRRSLVRNLDVGPAQLNFIWGL